MNKLQKVLSIFTAFALVLSLSPVSAFAAPGGVSGQVCHYEEDTGVWSVAGGGAGHASHDQDLSIPDEISSEECEDLNEPEPNTPPVITLIGSDPIDLFVGDTYTEQGATVVDAEDDPEPALVIGGDTVDTNTVGTYVVTYDAQDSDGADAVQITRTVNVLEDSSEPQECEEGYYWDSEEGECVEDTEVVLGCTDETAENYNSEATPGNEEAGDCIYDEEEYPYGIITNPTSTPTLPNSGIINLTAEYYDGDEENDDIVQWAVRADTCAAGTNTVFGNVDGFSDSYSWDGMYFSSDLDLSTLDAGDYCFIFNPKDDGETDIRETEWFTVEEEDNNEPIYGCMDPEATNYNENATEQGDVECTYDNGGGSGGDECNEPTDTAYITDGPYKKESCENTPPVITLIGDAVITITEGDVFTDPGATADDAEDGDITDDIVVNTFLDVNEQGEYLIWYNVTDSDGAAAEEVTRKVIVEGNGSNGGGGSVGNGGSGSGGRVLGATSDGGNGSGGSVAGVSSCGMYLTTYMKMGMDNDPAEVRKLQEFLNEAGIPVTVTGVYGATTAEAVKEFQTRFKSEILDPWVPFGFDDSPTGYTFKLTRYKINNTLCAGSESYPSLP